MNLTEGVPGQDMDGTGNQTACLPWGKEAALLARDVSIRSERLGAAAARPDGLLKVFWLVWAVIDDSANRDRSHSNPRELKMGWILKGTVR